jgi:hypothetical protein
MRTNIFKEQQTTPGFKVANDRMTVTLSGDANRDYKLKPAIIYRAENSTALREFLKTSLPVCWWSRIKG